MPSPFVADLHIHSRYSRATSRELDLEHLWVAAQRKGVRVVGTGDFTHPGWLAELQHKLRRADDGLYALRDTAALEEQVPAPCRAPVRFMPTVEISSIYKRDGRTRKVHNLVCMPDLERAAALSRALARVGNLASDGRPILGLDSRDLLEMVLEVDPERAALIPAHIWTPWFSALGSKSGFDSIEACFADLHEQIFAVETGLSSDPPMNWRLSALDRFALVSSSDAHSPGKLAREANLFCCELTYDGIFGALRRRDEGFCGTVEFFPEEGKYHLDGHRKCNRRMSPAETRAHGGLCPDCGKPVTVGVLYRVEELADRPEGARPEGARPFVSLVGLAEVVGEVIGAGPATKGVARIVERCLGELGCELDILRHVPLEELDRVGGPVLAEALRRMRAGELRIEGGYDGEFGTVHLLRPEERKKLAGQTALFSAADITDDELEQDFAATAAEVVAALPDHERAPDGPLFGGPLEAPAPREETPAHLDGLSGEQRRAVLHEGGPLIIWAGPGTGKTRTLTRRIAHRVRQGGAPERILAVTFTTRAAAEMRARLAELLGETARRIRVCTFHALALSILEDQRRAADLAPLRVIGEEERLELLARLRPGASLRQIERDGRALSRALLGLEGSELAGPYRALLGELDALDLDLLVPEAVARLAECPDLARRWRQRSETLCVDEYQDVNQSQYELAGLLAGEDLCVIGDADQSIYAFRGSDPRYFLRFAEDHPGATRVTLERSYRSASALLRAARQVVSHNPNRSAGALWSSVEGAKTVTVHRAPSAAAEAEHVVHGIERLVGGTTLFSFDSGRTEGAEDQLAAAGDLSFGDIAVLFRTAAQVPALREALDRSGIPYRCASPAQSPLDPLLDFLRAPDDDLAARLEGCAPAEGLSLLCQALCDEGEREAAEALVDPLAAQLQGLGPGLAGWGEAALSLGATAFLEADRVGGQAEAVSLLTLHASKGLEFRVVFIVGCEEGLLPLLRPGEPDADERLAEERRLFYVGMTRAERLLVLIHAAKRQLHGRIVEREPSRFISEIEPALRAHSERRARPRRARQMDLF